MGGCGPVHNGHEYSPTVVRFGPGGVLETGFFQTSVSIHKYRYTRAQAREDALALMRRVVAIEIASCPHCKLGHW
jgi:hypothetical protein